MQVSTDAINESPVENIRVGPIDRESFFEAQKRHRRSTWQISFCCVLVILLTGIPLSILITPLLWGIVIIITDIVNIFIPVADLYTPVIHTIEKALSEESSQQFLTSQAPRLTLIAFSSGSLFFLIFWFGVSRLIFRSGGKAILQMLDARELDVSDLEEKQLLNVVEEVSIAAGIKPPKVLLFDNDIPNAAVLGRNVDDSVLVVSRRLLDNFNRDETQGVVGHLVGSLSNGNLKISLLVLSVLVTLGATQLVLNGSANKESKMMVRRFMLASLQPGRDVKKDTELITYLINEDYVASQVEDTEKEGFIYWFKTVVRLPFIILQAMFFIVKSMVSFILIRPVLSWLWRTRCYLADSTAVQLTRNPDSLASALRKMVELGGKVPGASYMAHLFVVGAEASSARDTKNINEELAGLREEAKTQSWAKRVETMSKAYTSTRGQQQKADEKADDSTMETVNLQPSLDKRLKKLYQQGATGKPGVQILQQSQNKWSWLVMILAIGLLFPLFGMMLLCIYAVLVLATAIGLGASMLLLMLILGIFHPLLRML